MHKGNAMSFKDQVLKEAAERPAEWLGLHLAQKGLLIADVAHQLATGQKRTAEAWEAVKKMTGMGSTSGTPSTNDDEMATNVIVGDQKTEQHIYNHQPSSTLGKFAKAAALGAAILGAGGIGSIATMYACGIFNKPKEAQPEVVVEAPTFEADGYGLKIVPDDEVHE